MKCNYAGIWLTVVCAALTGCGGDYDAPITAEDAAPAEAAAGQPAEQPANAVAENAAQDEAAPFAEPEPEMVREVAKAGVGKKGRIEGEGLIVTPVKTYFLAREKITFDIQVEKAMQLYKAEQGYAPKSHEEFMEKIIKQNFINLPELEEGHRYVYVPEQEQLMVEHPQ